MRRALQARTRGDAQAGFTMIELLVAMLLMSIIGGILTSAMVNSMKVTRVQDDATRTLIDAKVAMERITREIRGANALTVCQPRTMSFTMTTGTTRTAITFTVQAANATSSEIAEDVTTTDLTTNTSTTTHKKVLGGLAIGVSDAVFTYSDAAGNPLTPQSMSPESYNPGEAKTIGVKVLMRRIHGHPAIQLYQLVSIRNFEV
jgi:prepilin-type N-terminal cleavage/methylation domain-containing protein